MFKKCSTVLGSALVSSSQKDDINITHIKEDHLQSTLNTNGSKM